MTIELLTKNDLQQLKQDLINEFRSLMTVKNCENEWLKTAEVKRFLKCSNGTLQNLRIKGKLKSSKVNGTVYYNRADVLQLFDQGF